MAAPLKALGRLLGRRGTTYRCVNCGRQHPPEKIALSEGNSSKQPRPFHCLCCLETKRGDKKSSNWQVMAIADARNCRRHGRHSPPPGGCCLRSA